MRECVKNMSDQLKAANRRRKNSSRGKLTKKTGQSYERDAPKPEEKSDEDNKILLGRKIGGHFYHFIIGNENQDYTENVGKEK